MASKTDAFLARLDPDVVDVIAPIASGPPMSLNIRDIKAHPERFRNSITVDTAEGFEGVETHTIKTADGGSFEVRVYKPLDPEKTPSPIHLNFHGGGFVLGDLFTEAQLCLSMREAGVVVVDVNYRHCPDVIWGTAFEDAWTALQWVLANGPLLGADTTSLSVGGVSAGGIITTMLHRRAHDAGIPLKFVMPTVTSTAGSIFYNSPDDSPYPAFREMADVPVLSFQTLREFSDICLTTAPEADAGITASDSASEARAKKAAYLTGRIPAFWFTPLVMPDDSFRGLAPVVLRTAELDMMCPEGEAYAATTERAGIPTSSKRYPGALHTFMFLNFGRNKLRYDADSIVALRRWHGLPALADDEVAARVDRVLAAVKAQQQVERETGKTY